nr:PREDICTED: protein tyrosine phosphatase type IVA 3 [Struthio camelus australis]
MRRAGVSVPACLARRSETARVSGRRGSSRGRFGTPNADEEQGFAIRVASPARLHRGFGSEKRECAPPPCKLPLAPPLLPPQDLKKYGATTVVRVCEVTYDKTPLEKDGITVMDWPFDDGAPPPSKIVEDWLNLLKTKFCEDPGCCVAVHCVAGLGRAPVLVALALIESGMKYEDAIQFIRQKRRGAINSKQLTYLEKYRPKQRLRFKDPHNHKNKCCIM